MPYVPTPMAPTIDHALLMAHRSVRDAVTTIETAVEDAARAGEMGLAEQLKNALIWASAAERSAQKLAGGAYDRLHGLGERSET